MNNDTENAVTILIDLCTNCGCEMMIDRTSTGPCGDDFAYVLAVCPNCSSKTVIYVMTRNKDV